MAIKKKKIRRALLHIILKPLKKKTERNLNEGKFLLKPTFKKGKTKVLSTRRYRIYVSQIEKLISGMWLLKLKVLVYCRFILPFISTFSQKRPSWTNKWKCHTSWISLVGAIIYAFNSNLLLCCVFYERSFR